MRKKNHTYRLVESGILLAIGFVLSYVKWKVVPAGGSVTFCSMLPLVLLGYKYGPAWGGFCGFVYGLLQMLESFDPPPAQTLFTVFLVILLDYLLAWTMVGLIAGLMGKLVKNPSKAAFAGAFLGIFGRYLCSALSGILVWKAGLLSFGINATWAFPEMVITAIVSYLLMKVPVFDRYFFRSGE